MGFFKGKEANLIDVWSSDINDAIKEYYDE